MIKRNKVSKNQSEVPYLTIVNLFSLVIICVLLFYGTRKCTASSNSATITLDPLVTYQEFYGWEVMPQAGHQEYPAQFQVIKDTLFPLVVNEVGINRVRLEIRSGAENPVDYFTQFINGQITFNEYRQHWYEIINDNTDPFVIDWNNFQFSEMNHTLDNVVIPIKQLIESNGDSLYINLCYVDFGSSAFEHTDDIAEYGEFMLATFQHLDSVYSWIPHTVEIILEPDNMSNWTGNIIGEVIVAANNRLQANGYNTSFIVPSTTKMSNAPNYFDQLITIPGALNLISEISYHRYSGVSQGNLLQIVNRAQQHGLNTSMLEWWHNGNTYETLHEDLKIGQNSAWQRGTLAWPLSDYSDPTALYHIDDVTNPSNPKLILNEGTKFVRQYFKFIRDGAQRIEALTTDNDFDPMAFINPGEKYVVVVKADQGGSFAIHGLPSGLYGLKYTTDNEYNIDLPNVNINSGDSLNASIPEQGVMTVYAKATTSILNSNDDSIKDFVLYQNHPNPFNPITTIQYHLRQESNVRLVVYNIRGQSVDTLVDGRKSSGTHKVRWNAERFASGVYFYLIEIEQRQQVRKMVLIR